MKIRVILACIVGFIALPALADETPAPLQKAIFAGGCFWCMEADFEGTIGVSAVVSGYTGGKTANPSYQEVSSGKTGHAEAVEITYDPSKVTYSQLLSIYWSNIDPTDTGGQFTDRGTQYRSEIFYTDEEQHKLAQASKMAKAQKLGKNIVTIISPATIFYPAEIHHQDYARKNPMQYNAYKYGSGRESRLKELNQKP